MLVAWLVSWLGGIEGQRQVKVSRAGGCWGLGQCFRVRVRLTIEQSSTHSILNMWGLGGPGVVDLLF